MNLPQISVSRPAGITVIYVSLIVVALFASRIIPVDILPPIEPPFVSVAITYQSASPEQIEQIIVKQVEEAVKSVEGVDEISSICEQGVAVVQVKFRVGENLDYAVQRINERLEFIKRTIQDTNIQFSVLRFTSSAFPVLFLGVSGKRDRASLYKVLDEIISPYVSSLPGVGGVLILADAQRNVNIWVDPQKMRKYDIGIAEVKNAIAQYNGDFSAGKITLGRTSIYTTLKSKPKTKSDIENIVVGIKGGVPIKLKDIAEVEVSSRYVDSSRSYFFEGESQETVILYLVRKRPGANIVEVSNNVKADLEKISEKVPADIKIRVLLDFADSIRSTIEELRTTLYYAVLAVTIVVFIFLRSIRESLILAISIPTSLLFSILFLYFLGKSLNLITLSAIIISSGIVIDNSIVVLESIRRRLEEGLPFREAIVKGANYVFTALLGSTITNFIVYTPIVFLKGLAFFIFIDFVIVIATSSIISLFVAISLIPALSSRLLKKKEEPKSVQPTSRWIEEKYKKALGFIVKHPVISTTLLILISIIPFSLSRKIKKEFIPVQEAQDMRIFIYLPKTASWKWAEEVAFKVKDEIMKKMGQNTEYIFLRYGESAFGRAFGRAQRFTEADNLILVGLRFKNLKYNEAYKIVSNILSEEPNIEEFRIIPANPINLFIFGQSRGIEMRVYSDVAEEDYVKFIERLLALRDFLRKQDFVRSADIEIDKPVPELQLLLTDSGKYKGFTPAYLGDYLSTIITGTQVGTVTFGGEDFKIFLRSKEGKEVKIEEFLNTPVKTPIPIQQDGYMYLSDVVKYKFGLSPSEIYRINGFRVGIISIDTTEASVTAAEKIKKLVKENFPEFDIEFGGAVQEASKTFLNLLMLIALAIFLVWASMVVVLESFSAPFIILLTIPPAISGTFLAMFLTNTSLSLISFLAIFLLAGIVVNNGIVLLDVIITKEREEGLSWKDAVILGASERLRPILMTSLTTIIGVIPSIFSTSQSLVGGKEFAIPTVGGLILSTTLTLFLMPAIYSLIKTISVKLKRA
jgi:hydrophobic/amphiphilic exporter-1 (mainly G- bacteria), HAE1 family